MQRSTSRKWIHILLKGENEPDLQNSDDYVREFLSRSLIALRIPVLRFEYRNLTTLGAKLRVDFDNILERKEGIGFILTSPRAVESVAKSLKRGDQDRIVSKLDPELIFVVGEKTGLEWRSRLGVDYNVGSCSSGSGVHLAAYICAQLSTKIQPVRLIYPKSSLADNTIEESLSHINNLSIDSIVTYGTTTLDDIKPSMISKLKDLAPKLGASNMLVLNLIFFSPSGVEGYFKTNSDELKSELCNSLGAHVEILYSSIGKTTGTALSERGVEVFCVASQPNPRSLVDDIVHACDRSHEMMEQPTKC